MEETLKAYDKAGQAKVSLPPLKMFIFGIAAGAFIALGGLGSQFAGMYVNKLAGAFVFPIGLTMVVLTGSELFTGNCLLLMPLIRKQITAARLIVSWCIVYVGNAIGGILVAIAAYFGGVLPEEAQAAAIKAFETKCALEGSDMLIRGILCNVLVCIAVYLAFSAKERTGKILSLFLPTALFVLCGFEHCVANWYFLPIGSLYSGGSILCLGALKNLFLVSIGNIVGGALISLLFLCGSEKKNKS